MTMTQTVPGRKGALAPALLDALHAQRAAVAAQGRRLQAALPSTAELTLLMLLLAAIGAWIAAALVFGYPGILLPALALVPTILVTLVVITWG